MNYQIYASKVMANKRCRIATKQPEKKTQPWKLFIQRCCKFMYNKN